MKVSFALTREQRRELEVLLARIPPDDGCPADWAQSFSFEVSNANIEDAWMSFGLKTPAEVLA